MQSGKFSEKYLYTNGGGSMPTPHYSSKSNPVYVEPPAATEKEIEEEMNTGGDEDIDDTEDHAKEPNVKIVGKDEDEIFAFEQ